MANIEDKKNEIMDRMTWKEVRFCHEYILDQNQFEAAKRAGFAEEEAYEIGERLMKHPDALFLITSLAAVENVKLKMMDADDISAPREVDTNFIMDRLARIADFNSQTVKACSFTKDGQMVEKIQMRDATSAIKALELLGKTKALFVNKVEHEVGKDWATLIKEARKRAGIAQPVIIEGEVVDE